MRRLRKAGARCTLILGIMALAIWLTGCQSEHHVYAEFPATGPEVAGTNCGQPGTADILHIGDVVRIAMASPAPGTSSTIHEERIKEDGTVTFPEIGPVKAAGRTHGELQTELQEKCGEKFYKNMIVPWPWDEHERYFYVVGEVNQRGPKTLLDETDVVKAISAAGGFTDFANRKNIRVVRPNGQERVVNYNKALEDPGYNVRIYPGDKIVVKRKWF
jgi:polysaccharide export outer membrane protein